MTQTKVVVLGAGSWGTTVASLLARRTETHLWARSVAVAEEIAAGRTNATYLGDYRIPKELRVTSDLEDGLSGASLVVLAVPSQGVRNVLRDSASFVGKGVPVLSLTKGLEQSSLSRTTEVILDVWPGRAVGVLTGPNLASEVLAGQPTASVIAMSDADIATELQSLFNSETMRVYTNPDLVGCEIAGVVKNVMALAAGMVVGLGFGDNTRAALITRALAELARLGTALGGQPITFSGLAGLGDLVATCTSEQSRNYSVGVALGRGDAIGEIMARTRSVAEGVRSSRPVVDLAARFGVEVPVAQQVVAVCHEGRSPSEAIPLLMGRATRSEFEASD